jgi:phosphoenolpyruvate synthase/pyruvate phosphate dikinase
MTSLFLTGYKNSWRDLIGMNYSIQDAIIIDGIYYYPEYHLKDFAKRLAEHILKNKNNFLSLKKKTLLAEQALLKTAKQKQFVDIGLFFKKYLEYLPTLGFYFICDDYIEDALRQELLKVTTEVESVKLLSSLNLPLDINFDQKIKSWFLKTEDIDGFIKKYSWGTSRYGQHKILSKKEAAHILKTLKKDKSLNNKDSRLETKLAVKRAKKILGLKSYYVDIIQFFVYYRTHRTDILNKVFFDYYKALNSFAIKLGIDYQDLIQYSYDELLNREIVSKSVLEKRKENFVACLSHGKIDIFSGSKMSNFRKLCKEKLEDNIITGRTAFPGIASGKVKIIFQHQDLDNFKKGEVLVASMTTPSMVMTMKKAAAFITDEGGITCHAAILAREMKKPCVIGTKNATKILKDCDLVEVDANEGIVKIIKK